MPAPALTTVELTPTGYLVAEWAAVTGATAYGVSAVGTGHSVATSYGATVTRGRSGARLYPGLAYAVTPSATVGGVVTTGAATSKTFTLAWDYGDVVRQAVWDALYAGSITMPGGAAVGLLDDGWWRPALLRRGEAMGFSLPAMEVGAVRMTGARSLSSTRRELTYAVDLTVMDASPRESAGDAGGGLGFVMQQVMETIDATANLGVAALSVMDKAWRWGAWERRSRRDRVVEIATELEVPVCVTMGAALA